MCQRQYLPRDGVGGIEAYYTVSPATNFLDGVTDSDTFVCDLEHREVVAVVAEDGRAGGAAQRTQACDSFRFGRLAWEGLYESERGIEDVVVEDCIDILLGGYIFVCFCRAVSRLHSEEEHDIVQFRRQFRYPVFGNMKCLEGGVGPFVDEDAFRIGKWAGVIYMEAMVCAESVDEGRQIMFPVYIEESADLLRIVEMSVDVAARTRIP